MMHVPVWRSLLRRPWVGRRRTAASGAVLLSGTLLLALGAYGALQWPVSGGLSVAGARQVSFGHGAGQGRVVRYTLTADETEFQIGSKRVLGKGYNGRYVGPTLYLRPGDTLELRLVNRLEEPTNLHFHGMHVSPRGLSDNIFRTIGPGETGVSSTRSTSTRMTSRSCPRTASPTTATASRTP
jgi:FtsP/CotA-like multicopper oxidase with cupredoxin domain